MTQHDIGVDRLVQVLDALLDRLLDGLNPYRLRFKTLIGNFNFIRMGPLIGQLRSLHVKLFKFFFHSHPLWEGRADLPTGSRNGSGPCPVGFGVMR